MNLSRLYELQLRELELKVVDGKINKLESDDLLYRLKQEYSDLKNQYLLLKESISEEKKQGENKKKNIRQLEENKSNYEKLKYSAEINNAKKLKMIEKQIVDVENNIKSEIKKIDALTNKIKKTNIEMIDVKKKLAFIKNKFEKTKNERTDELERLAKEKIEIKKLTEEIKKSIDENSLSEYTKQKRWFNDPISLIVSRKCTGCSVGIPSIDYEAVRDGDVLKCESCGRFLLYKKKSD
ncbi:MAG: C4-type zinc ribbon domain-containing protein [Firmicutes bacterium]|nr:C4-type zinc ribbon domain-containing protein [Bacillota bacterium]